MNTPTDPQERVALLKWLMDHRLWTHEATIRVRPGNDFLAELRASPEERKRWPTEVVRDGDFTDCVTMTPVFVNPSTETIEDDDIKNTALRFWIEAGGWYDLSKHENLSERGWDDDDRWIREHDYDLNCGAPTAEEALLKLALLVRKHYDDDGRKREK